MATAPPLLGNEPGSLISTFGNNLRPIGMACIHAQAFKYDSDWPFARPLYLTVGHYDGQLPRTRYEAWSLETSRRFELQEVCSGARSMLRDPCLTAELGAFIAEKVAEELARPLDAEADELEELARGVT